MKSSPRVAVTRFFFNPFTAALAADPAMEQPVVVDTTMMRGARGGRGAGRGIDPLADAGGGR